MTVSKDGLETAGVGMYSEHWKIVDAVAERAGHSNRSAAVRLIIERYEDVVVPIRRYLQPFEDGVISEQQAREQLHAMMDDLIEHINVERVQ